MSLTKKRFNDNNFELKILLNHQYNLNDDTQNPNIVFYKSNEFINNVKITGNSFKNYLVSEELPIVWFYFNNEKQRELFVKSLKEDENIAKIILYTNNMKILKSTVNDNFLSDLYFDKYTGSSGGGSSNTNSYNFSKYDILNKNDIFKILNFENGYKKSLTETDNNSLDVGVLEFGSVFDKFKTDNFFATSVEFLNNDIDNKNNTWEHSLKVSSIIGGEEGFDKSAKLYIASFNSRNGNWQTKLEKLIKYYGIRIINHSYGMEKDWYNRFYSEESFLLDYLSRKYGVINVISAGNENIGDQNSGWINNYSLSYNSITVGALDKNYKFPVKNNKLALYSNYKTDNANGGPAKPLVVAPGYFNFKDSDGREGTSFAAPAITGLISTLLKLKPNLNNEFRIPVIKSILSAAAISISDKEHTKNKNGFSDK
ncbi:S8 family serine peptidase [Mycoplasma sp. 4013]